MLKHPELTLARVERFIRNDLRPRIWAQQIPMQAAVYRPEGKISPEDAPRQAYVPVEPGYTWGPISSDAWFRFTAVVPPEWRGEAICALIDCGAEAVVWVGNDPRQGIDGNHREYLVTESARGGEEITLYVQATDMNPSDYDIFRAQREDKRWRLWLGDYEFLRGRALVGEIDEAQRVVRTPTVLALDAVAPVQGMAVSNEARTVWWRLQSTRRGEILLGGEAPLASLRTDPDGDGRAALLIWDIGEGDSVLIPGQAEVAR